MNDNLSIKGIFTLKVYDDQGNLIEDYLDRNLVVNGGRSAVTRLIAGDTTGRSVTKIGVGTNATAPSVTDTALTGSFVKALGTISYPTVSSVRWDWTLELTEANGMAIREFGLICSNDTLFARKTRDVINKTSSIRLVGTWELQF